MAIILTQATMSQYDVSSTDVRSGTLGQDVSQDNLPPEASYVCAGRSQLTVSALAQGLLGFGLQAE